MHPAPLRFPLPAPDMGEPSKPSSSRAFNLPQKGPDPLRGLKPHYGLPMVPMAPPCLPIPTTPRKRPHSRLISPIFRTIFLQWEERNSLPPSPHGWWG